MELNLSTWLTCSGFVPPLQAIGKSLTDLLANTALHSALLCSALLCSATVFQCSLASASFAEVQGGRSKMMRAALLCNICMSAIEVELPLSPHFSQLLFLLKRQSLFNCFMQTYGLENQDNLICYRSVLQTRDKKWTWSNLSLDERHF